MTLFPKTRSAWLRSGVIFLLMLGVAMHRNVFSLVQLFVYDPREGDVVFQSLPRGELVDAIEGITESEWSHCGIVMRRGSRWVVVEAIGHVRETPLAFWIPRGRSGRFVVYRHMGGLPANSQALDQALNRYYRLPYDFRYAPGDDEIYCSELVYKAYRDAYRVELGGWQALGTLKWAPFEAFIRKMEGGGLPLDREMITPVELSRSTLLTRIYPEAGS